MMYYSEVGDPNNDEVYYYCSDNLGSTIALVDSSGAVVERYSYDVWGEPTIYNGSGNEIDESDIANPFMFTAREVDYLDEDTASGSYRLKLQHNRIRVYNYKLASWMQSDPKGYVEGLNTYQYVLSNPVIYIDVLGLSSFAPGSGAGIGPYGGAAGGWGHNPGNRKPTTKPKPPEDPFINKLKNDIKDHGTKGNTCNIDDFKKTPTNGEEGDWGTASANQHHNYVLLGGSGDIIEFNHDSIFAQRVANSDGGSGRGMHDIENLFSRSLSSIINGLNILPGTCVSHERSGSARLLNEENGTRGVSYSFGDMPGTLSKDNMDGYNAVRFTSKCCTCKSCDNKIITNCRVRWKIIDKFTWESNGFMDFIGKDYFLIVNFYKDYSFEN